MNHSPATFAAKKDPTLATNLVDAHPKRHQRRRMLGRPLQSLQGLGLASPGLASSGLALAGLAHLRQHLHQRPIHRSQPHCSSPIVAPDALARLLCRSRSGYPLGSSCLCLYPRLDQAMRVRANLLATDLQATRFANLETHLGPWRSPCLDPSRPNSVLGLAVGQASHLQPGAHSHKGASHLVACEVGMHEDLAWASSGPGSESSRPARGLWRHSRGIQ